MSRAELSTQSCSIARAIGHIGDEWSLMILRELFLGSKRFDDFQRFTGMSSHLVSKRLRKLEKQNIIIRKTYSSHPRRYEYRLTKMGRELWPVIIALKQWGDRWLIEKPIPVQIQHKSCGHVTAVDTACSQCGEKLSAMDVLAILSESFENERRSISKSV